MERSDTHHVLDDGDGFREALNPSYDLSPDGLFDLPDGQIIEFPVQPLLQKYSASRSTQIRSISLAVPSHRGAARDRHGRGAGCGGRGCAKDERRLMRTAKSCGPDAPTLASSFAERSAR